MEFKVVVYENHEKDFYEKMGCFFANRKYAKEMGGWQFYTKDKSVWFVMYDNKKNVIGFNSIIIENTHLYFDNFYIIQKYRGNKYSNILSDARLNYANKMNKEIRLITDNHIQIKRYIKLGFVFYGKRGRYEKYKKLKL